MSEKNSDVVRAVESLEGESFPYHSFGPLVMRPRNPGELRVFTYNEFGEPEYAPERARAAAAASGMPVTQSMMPAQPAPPLSSADLADPLYDRLPVMQPPAMRSIPASPLSQPQQQRAAVRPQPASSAQMTAAHMMAGAAPAPAGPSPVSHSPVGPSPVAPSPVAMSPVASAPAIPPAPPPPSMMVEPAPVVPPPPPFFPLLAAALPNATEPSYTPSYPTAPLPQVPVNAAPRGAPVQNNLAAASVDASADRRSLADMFTLLGARAAAPTGAFPGSFPGSMPGSDAPSTSSQSDGQALFRRI